MSIVNTGTIHSKPEKMTEDNLGAVVRAEIQSATGFVGGETSEGRRQAMERYLGEPYGDELDGRSKAISTDVQDAIEDLQPDLMEIFASGDETVKFDPTGEEDVEGAEQATAYCNHIWNVDNPGYDITHDWSKDALLSKVGTVKIYWDDSEKTTRHTYTGLGFEQLLTLSEGVEEDEIEILEHSAYPDPSIDPALIEAGVIQMEMDPDGSYSENTLMGPMMLHDLVIKRTRPRGRVKIVNVPPEEFYISRRTRSLATADFTCHKVEKSVSELQEEGFSWEELTELPSHDEQDYNEERVARFNEDDEWPQDEHSLDPAARKIWVYECYLKVDFDGDGLTEMRQVIVAGPGYKVLRNEVVDDHPFVSWTPVKMPHKFFGRSIADLTLDIQRQKTTAVRMWNDNLSRVNNARAAISNQVDLDDYMTQRPGGPVRVDTEVNVQGHIQPLTTESIAQHVQPILEYQDQRREQRTGIIRMNQGLDSKALHETFGGANLIMGAAQRRKLYYARNFAEAMALGFKKILMLITVHQDEKRMIRLRGEFVEIDPRVWNTEMDAKPNVGLGHGTKETQNAGLMSLLDVQKEIVQLQGGAQGPLVKEKHIYETVKALLHGIGKKNHTDYIGDPESPENQQQQQEPPPDPEMVKVEMENQRKTQELQMEHQRDLEKMKLEHQLNMIEMQAKAELDQRGAIEDATRKMIESQTNQDIKKADFELHQALTTAELNLKEHIANTDTDLKRRTHDTDTDLRVKAAKKPRSDGV